MAISVFMRFHSTRDAIMLYESIINEMGRSGGVLPAGEVYHLAALATDGMFVADLWESREAFTAYAMAALIPLTAKRGLFSPEVEFCDVHSTAGGGTPFTRGTVTVTHLNGNVEELLRKYDTVETKLGFPTAPEGLVFQWCAKRPEGLCITAHWRSREEAETFVHGALAEALRSTEMPLPSVEIYGIYNTMDGRSVHA
jgi:hypothetical protein